MFSLVYDLYMQLWILYAVLAALFASLVAIFGKIGVSQVDSTLATTLRAWVLTIFLTLFALALNKFPGVQNLDGKAIKFIILSGLSGGISMLFYFLALKSGPTTPVAALDRSSLAFVLILSALFLGEGLTIKTALAVILMIAASLLIVLK
jgi:transporter family protein